MAFFGVKGPHFCQRFQAGDHVQVVVVAQPVGEGPHPLGFEKVLALFPFGQRKHEILFQARVPREVIGEAGEVELFGGRRTTRTRTTISPLRSRRLSPTYRSRSPAPGS